MVNLSALIVERVARCQKLYDEKPEDHEIILNIEPDVQAVVDKDHILKAIDNLIINAIQFCPKGKIEIELKRNEKVILFVIRDEGIGIPKGELSMIFDALHSKFSIMDDAEITLEANPDDISPEKLAQWRNVGINRLSIGVQSFLEAELLLNFFLLLLNLFHHYFDSNLNY